MLTPIIRGTLLLLASSAFSVATAQEKFFYYVLDPNTKQGDLTVTSLIDNNLITVDTPAYPAKSLTVKNLASRQLSKACNKKNVEPCVLTEGTVISGTGPFSIGGGVAGTDMPVPGKYAGTEFVFPQLFDKRHNYYVFNPSVDTTVTFQIGSNTESAPIPLNQGEWKDLSAPDPVHPYINQEQSKLEAAAIIRSEKPILLYIVATKSTGVVSAFPVPPAAQELWGVSTRYTSIAAINNGTNVQIFDSTGGSPMLITLNAGESQKYSDLPTHGGGPALYITAEGGPIGAIQHADGDGIEASSYLPEHLLDLNYAIPAASQYVVVACPYANTTVTLRDGRDVRTASCNAVNNIPGKAYFGDNPENGELSFSTGTTITSNRPVYVMYENDSNNAEHNIAGHPPQKNVLLVIADDLGVEVLGRYGMRTGIEYPAQGPLDVTDYPPTPTLDSLMDNGIMFRNAWSYPICGPTRGTIQTGRYGYQTGIGTVDFDNKDIHLKLDEWTIPEVLNLNPELGYTHALLGKWHLGNYLNGSKPDYPTDRLAEIDGVALAGYDTFKGSFYGTLTKAADGSNPDNLHYNHWYKAQSERDASGQPQSSETLVSRYALTDKINDAITWTGEREQDGKPWFLALPLNVPHSPFHAPPDNLHSFVELKTKFANDPETYLSSCPQADAKLCYKAMVEAMDTELGRLLESLTAEQRASTTVIFVGDNGTPGQSGIYEGLSRDAKNTLYEGGIHVPLIISGAGIYNPLCDNNTSQTTANCESNELTSTTDLFKTSLELMGVDATASLPTTVDITAGISLVSTLNGTRTIERNFIYAEQFDNLNSASAKTIRNKRFKLWRNEGTQTLSEKFYDLANNENVEPTGSSCTHLTDCVEINAAYDSLSSEIIKHRLYCNECEFAQADASCIKKNGSVWRCDQ